MSQLRLFQEELGVNEVLPRLPNRPGVYFIWNTISAMWYVGSTSRLSHRWYAHRRDMENGTHVNKILQRIAWKHGVDSFRVCILQFSSKQNLRNDEQKWFVRLGIGRSGLCCNILPVAGSTAGYVVTEETRRKLSLSQTGKKASDEAKAKMRFAKLGVKLTPIHRQRIIDARKRKPCRRPLGIIRRTQRKFTVEDVREIRRLKKCGSSYSELSRKYNTCIGPLFRIVTRRTYGEIL